MDNIKTIQEDNEVIRNGARPQYLVSGERLGTPFVTAAMAIRFHNILLSQGLTTVIMDLTEYDWDANPMKLRLHQLDTEDGLERIVEDIAMRDTGTDGVVN